MKAIPNEGYFLAGLSLVLVPTLPLRGAFASSKKRPFGSKSFVLVPMLASGCFFAGKSYEIVSLVEDRPPIPPGLLIEAFDTLL